MDSALSLLEWVEAFIQTLPTDPHPIGQHYIHETAQDMRLAAQAGDAEAVALCVKRIQHRIELEARFAAENAAT